MARLCPLFSGSKGNSIYVESKNRGILVDAGRSAKQVEKALFENNIDIKNINGIFLTHEHSDHISGVKVLASRYGIKVFASKGTMSAIQKLGILNGKFPFEVVESCGVEVSNMFIKPFKTPHDSLESTGYIIETSDSKRAVVATDIGYISDAVKDAITGADTVVIESNHDVKMLQNGPYPYFLKKRILSNTGHLSNESCADMLPFFIKNGTTRFILAHLSQENNMPDLAYQTAICNLAMHKMKENIDFSLDVAPVQNFGEKNLVF
ncbi:MAG: putative metallo-hydrolase YycJ [Eubacteriales bacterium SKADARSKE-1]|nr:putative metallo-hydrolase YycJ [Eubacteriales bacterium SKADARSKE-1]